MKSGTTYMILDIDKKGRLHIPADIRKNIGISDQVLLEKEKNTLIIKPMKEIEDPIGFLSSINIKTKKTPVEMKKEAEYFF